MTTALYGKHFSQKDNDNIKLQNRVVLKTFLKKIISNNKHDDTFKEYIETYFPVKDIAQMTDQQIHNNILRLSNISNILDTIDFNTNEMLCEIVKGFTTNIIPDFFPSILSIVLLHQ